MPARQPRHAFALIELVIAIVLIMILLALFVPALYSARVISQRDQCASNLTRIGGALHLYIEDNNDQFPSVPDRPSWNYGGVRFSSADGSPFLDSSRPLNRALSPYSMHGDVAKTFCCPADFGISGDIRELGTGGRSACRSFGTSYRANACLFDARLVGFDDQPRGLYRSEIITAPSRMLVMGDAVWYEVAESTGRNADWHNSDNAGNLLFLDNSVRLQRVRPRGMVGPVMFDPMPGSADREDSRRDDVEDE